MSFAFDPMSVEQAAGALEDVDHDFFLFRDAASVLYSRDDGLLALIELQRAHREADRGPVQQQSRFSSPIALQTAVEEMNVVGHRFVFFEHAAGGRGNVMYRRYDGHYALTEPARRTALWPGRRR